MAVSPIFDNIQVNVPKRNTFDLSHMRKQSMNMGDLCPALVLDMVPTDKIRINTTQLVRLAPQVAPVMHRVKIYMHFFFVPNRIIWENWDEWISGGPDGNTQIAAPYLDYGQAEATVGGLSDYLGLPFTDKSGTSTINALAFGAYHRIWHEYYRDQNLNSDVKIDLVDGNNQINKAELVKLRKRAWEKDYFTSGLPFTQRGPEATIPLGTSAPVSYAHPGSAAAWQVRDQNGNITSNASNLFATGAGDLTLQNGSMPIGLDPTNTLQVDLTQSQAASINDLRRAYALQRYLEQNARGGVRNNEWLLINFGIKSQDARLQRPEYIGGYQVPITFSEVLQTESTNEVSSSPQGNMAGHGVSVGGGNTVSYYAHEFGYCIGIMSVLPKTSYMQGIPKHFRRLDRFEYFNQVFQHLGEQPIENQELYFDPSDATRSETFAYTPRFAEYKFMNDTVHGDFKTSLDFWHMARKFSQKPVLNEDFVTSDPTHRIFAVTDTNIHKLYCQIYHNIKINRPMAVYGTPSY